MTEADVLVLEDKFIRESNGKINGEDAITIEKAVSIMKKYYYFISGDDRK